MPNAKSKKKWNRIILIAVLVLVLGGIPGGIYWRKRERPITVQTEAATRRNLTELVVANGKIQPVVSVVISPEVSGEIIELPVKEGQSVGKGDLLLRIKPDNYIAMRRSAEASYQSAIAAKNLAAANMKKAEIEYRRNDELFKASLISDV